MKKMLVGGLLSSVLAVSAVWGEYVDNDFTDSFSGGIFIKSLANKLEKKPCDEPESKACLDETKEVCGNDKECLKTHANLNNTYYEERQGANAAVIFFGEQFGERYNQQRFKHFLEAIKSEGVKIEDFLLLNLLEDRFINMIITNNLIKQAQDIKEVYGSLRNNNRIQEKIKGLKITPQMKNILF